MGGGGDHYDDDCWCFNVLFSNCSAISAQPPLFFVLSMSNRTNGGENDRARPTWYTDVVGSTGPEFRKSFELTTSDGVNFAWINFLNLSWSFETDQGY